MKNFKKRFAKKLSLLVTFAMLVSLLTGMTAFAADPDNQTDTTTIDTTKTGTIHVTKYVTAVEKTPGDATGTQADAATIEGDYYDKLDGAEFALFTITTDVKGYYDGTNNVDYSKKVIKYDYENNKCTMADDAAGTNAVELTKWGDSIVTGSTGNAPGEASFTSVPLGIYALVEISAPGAVDTPYAEPSIISVPMVNTDSSNNGGTGNDKWLYELYVYPKNTDTAKLVINKKDDWGAAFQKTGGVQFKLYKKELVLDGTTKKLPTTEWVAVQSDAYSTNATTGVLEISKLTAGTYGTQYKLVEVSTENAYVIDTHPVYFVVKSDNHIEFNSTAAGTYTANATGADYIAEGNYVNNNQDIVNDVSAGISTFPPTITVDIRNTIPSLTKKVAENKTGDRVWTTDAQYSTDDDIWYQLIMYVPNNAGNLDTFKLVDTPQAGITDAAVNATNYKFSYAATADGTYTAYDDFTTNFNVVKETDNQRGFAVTLTTAGKTSDKVLGKYVKIEYKANFNEDAVYAGEGNSNTATLTYSKFIDGDTANDATFVISDEARVYSYKFMITKYLDQISDTTKAVPSDDAGTVKFNLLDSSKNKMKVVKVSDGVYRIPLATDPDANKIDDLEIAAGADIKGTITVQGLEKGTYYLNEIQTLNNYNLLSDLITIEIDIVETTNWSEDGSLTTAGQIVKTYDSTNKTTYAKADGTAIAADKTTVTQNIINKKGFTLPKTGSMGFLVFCVIGIALVAGGAALMFSGRKKKIR